MSDKDTSIQELKNIHYKMVQERDWEKFHTPSNLAKSIVIEAVELLEKFQWADGEKSKEILETERPDVEDEVADIAAYIFSLCTIYKIDLSKAFKNKMAKNRKKYPIDECKGKSDKYTKYLKD